MGIINRHIDNHIVSGFHIADTQNDNRKLSACSPFQFSKVLFNWLSSFRLHMHDFYNMQYYWLMCVCDLSIVKKKGQIALVYFHSFLSLSAKICCCCYKYMSRQPIMFKKKKHKTFFHLSMNAVICLYPLCRLFTLYK